MNYNPKKLDLDEYYENWKREINKASLKDISSFRDNFISEMNKLDALTTEGKINQRLR